MLAYNPKLAFSYRRHGGSASQKTLLDGRRFRDERTYYRQARELAARQGVASDRSGRTHARHVATARRSPSCPGSSGTETAPG